MSPEAIIETAAKLMEERNVHLALLIAARYELDYRGKADGFCEACEGHGSEHDMVCRIDKALETAGVKL